MRISRLRGSNCLLLGVEDIAKKWQNLEPHGPNHYTTLPPSGTLQGALLSTLQCAFAPQTLPHRDEHSNQKIQPCVPYFWSQGD